MRQIIKLFFILLISANTSAQQTTITKLEDAKSDYDIQDSVLEICRTNGGKQELLTIS